MGSTGKRYKDAITRYDRNQSYSGSEALELVASLAGAKFNEGIDLVVRLGVDPRKAEEMIRGTVALPAGTGRDVRVAVFAQGEAAAAAPVRPRPRSLTPGAPGRHESALSPR